ncbi:winged helix-turn-helix domain-containing protein [Undibacter mobilis]|uniref:Transcriptional regulator CadC n=1 Tax=Undibacter mobilis TaxID=2292256 RepID=A0A371BAD9_9BRAD|nr:winged helix-turn-helix domain-containing protein [Undibacter mobilis]RDV04566.1 transcriptional regulator CadC [Undibacter mobilis]
MVFRFGEFELDQQRAELRGPDGGVLKLRPKSFEMLQFFVSNAGRVLTKQELMEAIWPKVFVGEDSLFQCIREIRGVLGDERRQVIKLATGGGYLFTPEVSNLPAGQPHRPDAAGVVPAVTNPPQTPADATQVNGRWLGSRRQVAVAAGLFGLCAVVALWTAAQAFRPTLVFSSPRPVVALTSIVDSSDEPRGTAMAAEVTARLTDGFAKIANISVIGPRPTQASGSTVSSDYEIAGELHRSEKSWTLRARLIKTDTGEVQSVAAVSVASDGLKTELQQSRLAAGVGQPLARRLNEILEATSSDMGRTAGGTKVVIEQAAASIYQTSRERFGLAQTLLQNALNDDPNNVDVAVALVALQMRGIQMVWYTPDEVVAAEEKATATIERALRAKPNSIAVLETYCRFLSATNHFAESLVTCARTLSFDPWNGLALFLVGLGQLHLGRFDDALATFQQADRFDTPPISRWTWLVGAGWATLVLGNAEAALPWLQRSIAITPATGRTHMLLAAAYQQLGRTEEAKAAMREGLKLRPGTTALNVAPPMKNASPAFRAASDHQIQFMIAAGLPEK